MSTRGFSRRDLLQLGGKLVMSVGAAKIVVALPGCGGDDGGGSIDAASGIDGGVGPDAYSYYPGYVMLDDCHAIGTYEYNLVYPGPPAYTYHYYWSGAYGCPYYVYPAPPGLRCYPDTPEFAPGYDYFCFVDAYYTVTMP